MKAQYILTKGILALLSLLALSEAAETRGNKVLLRNVQSLTLKKGLKTSHRRLSAVPQLNCIGGSGKPHYEVDVMRCTNSGSGYDTDDVEWTCKAALPPEFKLGSTDVICEGYSNSDDPFILKGSCGVEYRLLLTEQGQEKYGSKKSAWKSSSNDDSDYNDYSKTDIFITNGFWMLFIGVALWMIYSALKNYFANDNGLPRNPPRLPTGGGGNGGGDDDPPPPYDYRPSDSSFRSPPRKPASSTTTGNTQQGWRPGFWSGAAGGAAAGYAMGARGNQNRSQAQERENRWFGGAQQQQQQPRSNSWFGGGDAGEGSSGTRRSGSSSSPAPSPSRYESTGFGSTRRR